MSKLDELLGLVADENKEKAKPLVEELSKTLNSLTESVESLKNVKNDTVKSRDDIKSKIKRLGNDVGFDADAPIDDLIKFVKESIEKSKTSNKDVEQVSLLKERLSSLEKDNQALASKSNEEIKQLTSEIRNQKLELQIADSLNKYPIKPEAGKLVKMLILNDAKYDENGNVVFKDENDNTVYVDGKVATTSDMIKNMFEKEKESKNSMLFDISPQKSGVDGKGSSVIEQSVPGKRNLSFEGSYLSN